MPGEERLISGDVLDADNALRLQLDDAVDQEHGVAVRKNSLNRENVQDCHGKFVL